MCVCVSLYVYIHTVCMASTFGGQQGMLAPLLLE